jgi:hypothetical protein
MRRREAVDSHPLPSVWPSAYAACGGDDSTTGSTEAATAAAGIAGSAEKTKPTVTVPKGAPPKKL